MARKVILLCKRCKTDTQQEYFDKVIVHRNNVVVEKFICTVCNRKNEVVTRFR